MVVKFCDPPTDFVVFPCRYKGYAPYVTVYRDSGLQLHQHEKKRLVEKAYDYSDDQPVTPYIVACQAHPVLVFLLIESNVG